MDKKTLLYVALLSTLLFGVNWYFDSQHQEQLRKWNEQQALKKEAQKEAPKALSDETYYVLENPYQQLVFSSKGGALAEINLPFKDKEDPESVVKEIGFDRKMVEQEPQNAHFPAHSYKTADGKTHEQGELGGYYPLIRRDLIQKNPEKSVKVPSKFYAGVVTSDFPEVGQLEYQVTKFTPTQIVFESKEALRTITKTFTLIDDYIVQLDINIDGDARGLWIGSGIPEVEWISGGPAPALKYRQTRSGKPEVVLIDLPKDTLTVTSTSPDWAVNSNGFLGMIMDPLNQRADGFKVQYVKGTEVPSRLVEIDEKYNLYPADKMPGYNLMLPLKGGNTSFRFFAGPFATDLLKKIDNTYTDPETGYNPDYIASQTFHGWFAFISEPFARFLLILMKGFYWLTHSWALSIVLLTVALRIILYPLNAWSMKSTLAMQKIAPEVTKLQEKYKKDPKKAQMEIVNLYREKGVNPLSGCLPMLIQMPFLIGMFDLLKSNFELRGATFIPGWINDLAAPDVVFSWGYPLPFIGNSFHLLPFILGAVMFFQQRLMSPGPSDPSKMTDQQRQSRSMGTMMAVVFTFLFYNFPSGLNIYWLSSMLLGMGQQWWMQKRSKQEPIKQG
ncbi:MAG: membrane protein insertase YidC [Chlamydiia bacterium]|nr:membrane protein insertase YidC [Chlamydiia bacterium]